MDYVYHYNSPLGGITLTSDGNLLNGLWFDGQNYHKDKLLPCHKEKNLPIFDKTVKWLDIYFSGKMPDFTPALHIKTTMFRKLVWEILLKIPFGHTMTYGRIARCIAVQMGIPCMSAQAVGGAVGHNPISIIIPCHRVIGSNGSLTGYAGGLDRKIKLLEIEGVKTGIYP